MSAERVDAMKATGFYRPDCDPALSPAGSLLAAAVAARTEMVRARLQDQGCRLNLTAMPAVRPT
jgi:hypothetical protein